MQSLLSNDRMMAELNKIPTILPCRYGWCTKDTTVFEMFHNLTNRPTKQLLLFCITHKRIHGDYEDHVGDTCGSNPPSAEPCVMACTTANYSSRSHYLDDEPFTGSSGIRDHMQYVYDVAGEAIAVLS